MADQRLRYDANEFGGALGSPKYYIDTAGLAEGQTYFWFPTSGDSMTDETAKSIPSGSLVLGRYLKFQCISDIPLHRPIVVIIHYAGQQYCILKSAYATRCDSMAHDNRNRQMLCLRSYNPAPRHADLWVPYSCVKFVFVVENVRLPDGHEFVPRAEVVNREGCDP
jgi:hypothetical protein